MLNTNLFEHIQKSKKHILVVTKYWDREKTLNILKQVSQDYWEIFYGIWENRIEQIKEKNFDRDMVHFIWNIQSKKIKDIVRYCSTIHSLSNLKHAQIIEWQSKSTSAFIQIGLDKEKQNGISVEELPKFLKACKDYKYLKIIWISGMWSMKVSEKEKREEFQLLKDLRNKHIPHWLISAGTSADYEIALEEWIDIVRVGQKAVI